MCINSEIFSSPETILGEKKQKCSELSEMPRKVNFTGLLRALFFGEKCATCVQFMECAGVRSICCVSIKYEFLFDKSRQISINIM